MKESFYGWTSGADPDRIDRVEKPGQSSNNCILSDYYCYYYFKPLQCFFINSAISNRTASVFVDIVY